MRRTYLTFLSLSLIFACVGIFFALLQQEFIVYLLLIPMIICVIVAMVIYFIFVKFKCPKCGSIFKGNKLEIFLALHTPTKRLMSCPNCKERLWCKENFDKSKSINSKEKKMINEEQIKNINQAEKVVFTTSSKDNWPRSVWVVPSRVEPDRIIISNIQMHKSYQNIKENSKCFINVYIPEKEDLQIKIEGEASVYESGELFEEIKNYEESENLPPELTVNSIIVVKIVGVEESCG